MRAHIRWGLESGWLLGVIEGRGIKTGEVGMMGSGVGGGGGWVGGWGVEGGIPLLVDRRGGTNCETVQVGDEGATSSSDNDF